MGFPTLHHALRRADVRIRLAGCASMASLAVASPALAQNADRPIAQAPSKEDADIIVTGSRLGRSGFSSPSPVTVLDAGQLQQRSQMSILDALNQIPSFRATVTPATASNFYVAIGSRSVDLRALGPQRTLVLVDGRRFIGSTAQGTVDLNLIPSTLLSRTEVVTGGASAQYGSDAVAGVVNLIIDDTFEGVRGQAQFGRTNAGDNSSWLLSAAGGMRFGQERGHFVIGVEYEKANGSKGDTYSRGWGEQEYNVLPNPLYCNGPSPGACAGVAVGTRVSLNGLPANMLVSDMHTSTSNQTGVFKTPGPLFNMTFNEAGTALRPFNQGNLAGPIFMQGGEGHLENGFLKWPLLAVPLERVSTFARASFEISPSLKPFVELNYGLTEGRNVGTQTRDIAIPGASNGIRITQDNPFLSAGVRATIAATGVIGTDGRRAVYLGRVGDDFGPTAGYSRNELVRVAAGFSGEIAEGWDFDAYYQYGSNRYRQTVTNNRITARFNNAVDAVAGPGGPVCYINADAASANDDPNCIPINVFGENQWSAQAKAYAFGTSEQSTHYRQDTFAANIRGDLFDLPGGTVSVAAGLEHRLDKATGTADPISQSQGFSVGNASAVNGRIAVTEGYLEAVAPLLRDLPMIHSLELNGAVRRTDYSTSGAVTTWKLGGVWEPVNSLRLRVTRSRDIRAPNFEELYVTGATFVIVRDPFRAGQQAFVFARSTAASNLRPERADTLTAGIVFAPRAGALSGLSADYYDIRLKDAIARPTGQIALDRCFGGLSIYCPLIERVVPGDTSSAISSIALPSLNVAEMRASGIDFEADYRMSLDWIGAPSGMLNLRVLGSYIEHLITNDGVVSVDRAGQNGYPIGLTAAIGARVPQAPHWTMDATATLSFPRVSLTANMRLVGAGRYDNTLIGPDEPGYDVTLPNSINDNHVEAVTYFNIAANYSIFERDDRKVQIYGAIDNLFDRDPPVAPQAIQTNPYLYDVLGRTYRVGLRFSY
jgi:iron complex outermembrane receptor protein